MLTFRKKTKKTPKNMTKANQPRK